jgi:hypothetical protein
MLRFALGTPLKWESWVCMVLEELNAKPIKTGKAADSYSPWLVRS